MRGAERVVALAVVLSISGVGVAGQSPDAATIAAIKDEGLHRSHVVELAGWLSDVYGPRLTGSPTIEQAKDWVVGQMRGWGLTNVHEERFAFGRGWSLREFHAHMVEPQIMPIIGYPRAWTGSTRGLVTADVVRVDIRTERDFERYRGKLRGTIVLPQAPREVRMLEGDLVLRMDERLLAQAEQPVAAAPARRRAGTQRSLADAIGEFYRQEGVVAVLDRGSDAFMVGGAPSGSGLSWPTQRTDGGTIFVSRGGARDAGEPEAAPAATIAVEHYNRMARILDRGVPVRVRLNIQTEFHDEDDRLNGFNIIGEIPGTDLRHEIVMLGAHFDSTHAATGATDNASGSAAMMEALRILKAIGATPRRTIRIALWGAEEQGLLGSREYVRRHFGGPGVDDRKADHARLSAYYNLDHGAGRIRGVWLQGHTEVAPIFERWLADLSDLGVTTLGRRSPNGTDHVAFDEVGLPGFQFMQDRLEYNSRTHHSNMDFFDRLQRGDLVQMAVVAAVFAYNTAMLDERLPRKPDSVAVAQRSRN